MSEAQDFLSVAELSRRTGFAKKTLYNQYSSRSGVFGKLLRKVGGRLLMSRADYDAWLKQQQLNTGEPGVPGCSSTRDAA